MKTIVGFANAISMLTLFGCAHSAMRGTVAMKVSDEEAHVCLGDNQVKAGDKVALFKNACVSTGKGAALGGPGGSCRIEKIGEGVVERTLNEHYSVVKFSPGVKFDETNFVEKQ